MTVTDGSGFATFDPQPVLQTIEASPLLCGGSAPCSVDFKTPGGIDLGITQYGDAFQRGNFWTTVQPHPDYHILLQPVEVSEQHLNVPSTDGGTSIFNGIKVGWILANYANNYFTQTLLPNLITSGTVKTDGVVLLLIRDVCLADNTSGCQPPFLAWGDHNYLQLNGYDPQTYAVASYVDDTGKPGPQDVDVLSHEIGEWIDDPFVNNSGCPGGLLEVGDPLVDNGVPSDYQYTVNGFTYHLQDLVWLPYFGETPATSAGGQFSFQGESLTVCKIPGKRSRTGDHHNAH